MLRPRRLAFRRHRNDCGYTAIYTFESAPGDVLLQQVTTSVRFVVDGSTTVTYESSYGELFEIGGDGRFATASRDHDGGGDEHSFDVWRDGWSVPSVRRLLTELGIRDRRGRLPRHTGPRIEVRVSKRFCVGSSAGAVDVRWIAPPDRGGRYAFPASGSAGAPRAEYRFRPEPGAPVLVRPAPPPLPVEFSGHANFAGPVPLWRSRERLRYDIPARSGSVVVTPYRICEPTSSRSGDAGGPVVSGARSGVHPSRTDHSTRESPCR